ncbi:MAG TPA: T9SS type A sorting domain-containing protein, partial [Flavobacteriales bacterium]|nr:T9SS type A sorting domain-containing protein [Flavobacteriales bacterium]
DALPLSDGRVLISGQFKFPGDAVWRYGARLLPDGSVDPSFPMYPSMGGRITPWQDKLYVGLSQTVRRLFENGTIDPAFQHLNSNAPLFSSLQGGDYHVYPDGRIVISGAHTMNDPEHGFVGLYNLIWFTNTGQLDTTKHHRQCDEVLYEFEEQPDGKFLCTGTMTEYEGQPVGRVFRIHSDGELDTSFSTDLQPWGGAYVFQTLADGRILAGGFFKLPGSEDIFSLLRFMPDGALDPTFNLLDFGVAFNPQSDLPNVRDIHLLGDGRMVVTGWFDRINGEVRGGIAMLTEDGELLPNVFEGDGCGMYNYNGTLYLVVVGLAPSPDGNYYIWGAYHGYDDGTTNDPTQRFVSRLYGLNVGLREQALAPLQLQPNPTYGPLTVLLPQSAQAQHAEVLDAHGRMVWSKSLGAASEQVQLELSALSEGAYLLRLRMKDGGVRSGRFVIMR